MDDALVDAFMAVYNEGRKTNGTFTVCYIFKSLSGFAWNPTTKLWGAEPEVWDALIEVKPKVTLWKTNPFLNYEKMMIFRVDRVGGEEGETIC
ncbi:hypothetical protein K1719_031616 [Acacia pycnantha]|nr:hypothetical protein K1719_031616 [Acacia pycnantha]